MTAKVTQEQLHSKERRCYKCNFGNKLTASLCEQSRKAFWTRKAVEAWKKHHGSYPTCADFTKKEK